MKKFFTLFAAALMVLSASAKSVHKLNKTQFTPAMAKIVNHNLAGIKHAPAQTLAAFNATITVSNITANGAQVDIAPANKTVTYYWDIFDAEEALLAGMGMFATMGINNLEDYIMYYYESGYESVGDDSWTYTQLEANTEYVVLAVEIDADGTAVGEVAQESFTTLDGGSSYDMPEDVDVAYATADVNLFQVDAEEGYAYVKIVKDTVMFSTLIYIEEGATDLAAGTYPINDTFEPGTAQSGSISGNNVYPTFWATMDAEGYLYVPMFFCVDGSVVVSYDVAGELVLEVNATNTWGNTLHLTLNKPATAIENVEAGAKAIKAIKNGHLVIEKNGVKFNALGLKL